MNTYCLPLNQVLLAHLVNERLLAVRFEMTRISVGAGTPASTSLI